MEAVSKELLDVSDRTLDVYVSQLCYNIEAFLAPPLQGLELIVHSPYYQVFEEYFIPQLFRINMFALEDEGEVSNLGSQEGVSWLQHHFVDLDHCFLSRHSFCRFDVDLPLVQAGAVAKDECKEVFVSLQVVGLLQKGVDSGEESLVNAQLGAQSV